MPQTTVCRSMWPQLCHDLCMYTGYALDIWCHLRHVTLAVILITARNVRTIFVVEISVRPAFFTMLSCDEALCACAPVKCRARSRSWHAMPVRWRHAVYFIVADSHRMWGYHNGRCKCMLHSGAPPVERPNCWNAYSMICLHSSVCKHWHIQCIRNDDGHHILEYAFPTTLWLSSYMSCLLILVW